MLVPRLIQTESDLPKRCFGAIEIDVYSEKFDLVHYKRKPKPKTEEPVKKNPRGMAYRVGIWDGISMIENTDLPLPSSLKSCVTYTSIVDAYREARRLGHHDSECDFEAGTDGKRVVLIEFKESEICAVLEFDKNAREHTILSF